MTDYENVPFEEAAMLLHIVEGAARVQGLQSLSGAALTRLKEIDGECLTEAKALASAKADEAAIVNQARLRANADPNDNDSLITSRTTPKVIPSTSPTITENNRRV